jgi:hypothetical protein
MTIFCCCCCLLIKATQQHGKNENKNTGLFINCMEKIKSSFFFVMLGLGLQEKTTNILMDFTVGLRWLEPMLKIKRKSSKKYF